MSVKKERKERKQKRKTYTEDHEGHKEQKFPFVILCQRSLATAERLPDASTEELVQSVPVVGCPSASALAVRFGTTPGSGDCPTTSMVLRFEQLDRSD
jgi:hypothetical protein